VAGDAEARLARAFELAWRHLDRRERTVAEMHLHLERREIPRDTAERVVASMVEDGYLDDARYAQCFAEDKRSLEGWGTERIARDLRRRGVERDVIGAALGDGDRESELDAAVGLLRRRFAAPPRDARDQRRALGVLIRKGYDPEIAGDAIRCYRGEASP
jgi:regulatory protein